MSIRDCSSSSRGKRGNYLICTWEADGGGSLGCSAAADVDLGTLHVQLRALAASRGMESNQLTAEQVLAVLDARRDSDGLNATVGNQLVHSPELGGGIIAFRRDLEPAATDTAISLRICNLLHVGHDWAFVGGIDDVGGGGSQSVTPVGLHGLAGLDIDDFVGWGGWVGAAVAGDVVRGDVLDRSIVGRDADTDPDTIFNTAGNNLGHDGMGRGCGERRSGDDGGRELHDESLKT